MWENAGAIIGAWLSGVGCGMLFLLFIIAFLDEREDPYANISYSKELETDTCWDLRKIDKDRRKEKAPSIIITRLDRNKNRIRDVAIVTDNILAKEVLPND